MPRTQPRSEVPLTAEQRARVEQYMPLAKARSARAGDRLSRLGYGEEVRDDIRAVSYLALCLAAQSYDPSRGKTFAGWAIFKIQCAIAVHLRDEAVKGFGGSLQLLKRGFPMEGLDHPDAACLAEPDDEAVDFVDYDDLVGTLSEAVKPRHREWFVRRYTGTVSQGQLAAEAGCGNTRMVKILENARKAVRDRFPLE